MGPYTSWAVCSTGAANAMELGMLAAIERRTENVRKANEGDDSLGEKHCDL
jgi:hypothetical protein